MKLRMKAARGWPILALTVLVFAGCTQQKPDESAKTETPPAQEQRPAPEPPPQAAPPPAPEAQPSPAPAPQAPPASARPPAGVPPEKTVPPPAPAPPAPAPEPTMPAPPAVQEPKPAPAPPPEEPKPASSPIAPQKPVAPPSKSAAAREVMILTGAPIGGVRLEHKLHAERAGNKCETCHHASRPQKPATAPQQRCSECHTKVAAAPMKTRYQAAFHNPTAQTGVCVDCHKAEIAKGNKAPLKCAECHKKDITAE